MSAKLTTELDAVLSVSAGGSPRYARLTDVVQTRIASRSWLYEQAAAGRLRFVKLGRRTLVDLDSLNALLSALPTAAIRPTKTA